MRTLAIIALLAGGVLALGGEIENYHRAQAKPSAPPQTTPPVDYTKHGVTEIGIERTPCRGSCPAYTFIVGSDGAVRYTGDSNSFKKGAWRGKISVGQFNRLAQFMCDSDFKGMEDWDVRQGRESATVYTTFVLNGTRKTVRHYDEGGGPNKLWAIEQLIDSLIQDVKWDPGIYSPPKAP